MHPKYQEVIKLRKKGKSYGEIAKAVGVSKNSVSRWCKNLKLPRSAREILKKKNKQNREILAKYNRLRAKRARAEHRKIKRKAAKQISSLSKYELLLIGAALYWGEGWKKQSRGDYTVEFANSDPAMIRLFLCFMRKVLQVPENKFKVSLQLHTNINEGSTINFWSEVTNIPEERFRITRQISRASKGKRPKNSLPYGTLRLRVYDYRKIYKIKGWINGLARQNELG